MFAFLLINADDKVPLKRSEIDRRISKCNVRSLHAQRDEELTVFFWQEFVHKCFPPQSGPVELKLHGVLLCVNVYMCIIYLV